ncbi:MAG TPA: hypothetical protein VM073_04355 [Usitatibacter sp.]|nr:hypothetical protein [Usitatibacter sp.]
MDYQSRQDRRSKAQASAVGLGWFSIGLGLAELLFARPLARAMGMRGQESVLRFYGVREIATGVGLLTARDRGPWVWGRVAGDALDVATLAANLDGNRKARNVVVALGAVAGATALDVVTAKALTEIEPAKLRAVKDYSDRSGFPQGLEAARGSARDFAAPRDMRIPEPMRPRNVH